MTQKLWPRWRLDQALVETVASKIVVDGRFPHFAKKMGQNTSLEGAATFGRMLSWPTTIQIEIDNWKDLMNVSREIGFSQM